MTLLLEDGTEPLADLQHHVARAAGLFAAGGIREGDAVALLLRNGPAFLVATMAAQRLGAYAVPINWHFAPPEVAYVLADCGARILVGDADLLATISNRIAAGTQVFSVDGDVAGLRAKQWDRALADAAALETEPRAAVQSMIYTSGTTGRPKGVRRFPPTREQASAQAAMRAQIYGHGPGMRALLAAPLYHSAPNFFALNILRSAGLLVLQRKFDAEATLRLIDEHRITHMFMVPSMFMRLLALPAAARDRFDLSSLRHVVHAGAPCPAGVKASMIDWWGPVLSEYYGSTELGPLTFCNAHEWLSHRGTVGRALDGVVLSVRDEAGSPCGPFGIGEIHVERSPQGDFTYHGNDEKRRAMETGAGLATGDLGYLDDAGHLYICDRLTDMVISGGVNIYPAEIEAALMEIDGVADCTVLGAPDPEFGEKLIAFVQPLPGLRPDPAALEAALRERIAGYKVPRDFRFSASLPRDDNGKIFKRILRAGLREETRDI